MQIIYIQDFVDVEISDAIKQMLISKGLGIGLSTSEKIISKIE